MGHALLILLAFLGAVIVAGLILIGSSITLWIQAQAAGVPLSIPHLVMIRLRRLQPAEILEHAVRLWKAGLPTPIGLLEAHALSGGNLPQVVEAFIAARKAGLTIDFSTIAAIDLAGRDVADAVQARVNPKVVTVPPAYAQQDGISGVARDGVRLAARARVTVRTRLDRLVGGAGEETIAARVGEGIVAAIGGADSHRDILEKPDLIARRLLEKGLDSGTCFEILSVDIADIDVMDNVAARLRSSQAAADTRIAQAQAEVRRAQAVAAQQEMRARTVESASRVTGARATVPLALASASVEANLGSHRPWRPLVASRCRWQRGA